MVSTPVVPESTSLLVTDRLSVRSVAALKLALVLLFCLPGVPCVYYGTEAGLSGGAEPGCREAFPWGDPGDWPHDLRPFIASLAALRREQPALRGPELEIELLHQKIDSLREQEVLALTRAVQELAQLLRAERRAGDAPAGGGEPLPDHRLRAVQKDVNRQTPDHLRKGSG